MSNSDIIALVGLVVNVILTFFNAGMALFIARKTIQAALEAARPTEKLRLRSVKRRNQHPLRRLIRSNRIQQLMSVLFGLVCCLFASPLTLSSGLPVLWWSLAAVTLVAAGSCIFVFVICERIIRGVKRNLPSIARKLKQGRMIDVNYLP